MARKALSVGVAKDVSDGLFEWLSKDEWLKPESGKRPVYAVDGASIEVSRTKELLRAYPPCEKGYYPMIRMVVCHDMESGLAVRPEYGPFSGSKITGEVALLRRMFSRLPKDAIFIGDRLYGIFSVVDCAQTSGRDVIFRLTNDRAKKVLGREPKHGIDTPITWHASHHDRAKNKEFTKDSQVKGRVICMNVQPNNGGKPIPLYLFTTLQEVTAEELIEMYGKRWNVETDLRTLKRTASMHMLNVKTVAMAEKELLLGTCAYNLVIAVRSRAAKKLQLAPRSLSFKRTLQLMEIYAPQILAATPSNAELILKRFWRAMKAAKHPNRKKVRVEPRAIVRNKRSSFPTLKGSRTDAQKKIQQKN